LAPEKADTYTAGLVFTPSFLPSFNMTIDYYNITIKNFITSYGANLILNTCLSTGNPFYCNKVVRTQGTGTAADGSLWISPSGYIEDGIYNLGSQRANGIDVSAAYRLDMGRGGKIDFDFIGTYVLKFETEPVPGLGSYDCAGFYGPTCGAPNPRWKHKLRATWTTPYSGLDLYAAWRQINGVAVDVSSANPHLSGFVGPPAGAIGNHLQGIDYLDLGAEYSFLDHMTLRVGANNVLDKIPPLAQTAYSTTVFWNGNTYPSVYDALGRYVYINLTAQF
jgi:outer membrane receptor protein involved in Fe transport